MSWRDALGDIKDAAAEEFGEAVWHFPMLRLPNQAPYVDPARPAYLIANAVFDRNKSGKARTDAELSVHHKGRHGVVVPTAHPVLSIRQDDLQYAPSQADEFLVLADNDRYRVLNIEPAMLGMTRIMLEKLGRIDA